MQDFFNDDLDDDLDEDDLDIADFGKKMLNKAIEMKEKAIPIDDSIDNFEVLLSTIYQVDNKKQKQLDKLKEATGCENLHDFLTFKREENHQLYDKIHSILNLKMEKEELVHSMQLLAMTDIYNRYRDADDPESLEKKNLEAKYIKDLKNSIVSAGYKEEDIVRITALPFDKIEKQTGCIYSSKMMVTMAKDYFVAHPQNAFAVEDFLNELAINTTVNDLTPEQKEAIDNKRAKLPYDKEMYKQATTILKGAPLTKEMIAKTIPFLAEQNEALGNAAILNENSSFVQKIQKDLTTLKDKLAEKGFPKEELERLTGNYDASHPEKTTEGIDKVFQKMADEKLLENNTDDQLNSYYAKLADVFEADKYPQGAPLNTKNAKTLAEIYKDLKHYNDLVQKNPDKKLEDKIVAQATLKKFFRFADIKGLGKDDLEKLMDDPSKEVKTEAVQTDPVEDNPNRVPVEIKPNELEPEVGKEEIEPMTGYKNKELVIQKENDMQMGGK